MTSRLRGRVNVVDVVVVVVVVVVVAGVAVSCYFIDQMIEASYGGKWIYRTPGPDSRVPARNLNLRQLSSLCGLRWLAGCSLNDRSWVRTNSDFYYTKT